MRVLAIYNHPIETLGTFREFIDNVKEIYADEIKGDEKFDALIIMGGPMGVYEKNKYSFLEVEIKLIKKAFKENKLLLGICLGSQLIAEALGGKVIKGPYGPEIGIMKVKNLGEFKNIYGDEMTVFQWHSDTFSLPDDAELLAYSSRYFQAFKIKKTLALQFHLEVTSELVSKWIKTYTENEELINELSKIEHEFRNNAKKLMEYWKSLN
ncbi:MAG: type 1 glutamine amidotransferase [Thermoprotei archaeon]|jgi:GMP synthase-like glutamine amidotransferase